MNRQVTLLLGSLALAAAAVTWSGCSTTSGEGEQVTPRRAKLDTEPPLYNEQGYNTRETAARASRTDVPRYVEPEEGPKPVKTVAPAPQKPTECGASEFTLKSDLLQLQKRVPARATLGQQVENDLVVTPLANCAEVAITDTIPEGATYVKSEPNATVQGKKLTWLMDTLDKGNQVVIKVWYKADKEGCLVNCATMTAIPRGCAATVVGSAKLVITCSLPANAKVGSAVNKVIEVKNVGSAAANNVVVTDTVPAGLASASGQSSLTFNIGDLAPGEAKQIPVALKAQTRGPQTNVAMAQAANAEQTKSECATVINQPGLNITKEGTKEQFIGRTASYNIVVSNTGDTDLPNVVVTDTAPAGTRLVKADEASITGDTATWKLASLAKGAKQSFQVVLTSGTAGSKCNAAAVTCADGLSANAQACTLWKGVAAILLETKDDPDPIGVGETVTYTIRVTNQGTADDTNVKVVAKFGKEIDPVSSSGGTVAGKTVTFPPLATLGAKQVITYTITAKGVATGDHRLKVDLTSDILTEPVSHEESTHVY